MHHGRKTVNYGNVVMSNLCYFSRFAVRIDGGFSFLETNQGAGIAGW